MIITIPVFGVILFVLGYLWGCWKTKEVYNEKLKKFNHDCSSCDTYRGVHNEREDN